MEPKGAWKHCWERRGDPVQVPGVDGRMRYDQKYACRTCGAEISARCSGKIRTATWRKQGVKPCDVETVERVHAL